MRKTQICRLAFLSSVSLLPVIGLIACTTVAPSDYELCTPVAPATDCGDDVPVVVE